MTPKELWGKIFNSDLEEPFLERNNLTKNFDDMGTEEEMAPMLEALEGKTMRDIVDYYLQYNGHGLYASDLRYLIIDLLEIDDIEEIERWE